MHVILINWGGKVIEIQRTTSPAVAMCICRIINRVNPRLYARVWNGEPTPRSEKGNSMDDWEWDEILHFPFEHLFKIGTKLFIYENNARIGIGEVIHNDDEYMHVRVEFTVKPTSDDLYYGLVSEAAGLGE